MQFSNAFYHELIILLSILILLIPAIMVFKRENRWKMLLAFFIIVPVFVAYLPGKKAPSSPIEHIETDFTPAQRQAAFQQWFKEYQAGLDNFDKSWQKFNETVGGLEAEELSRGEAAAEFTGILNQAQTYHQALANLLPPPELAVTEQELISGLLEETQSVSAAQLLIIEKTINLLEDETTTQAKQAELANEIKKLALLHRPVYLDIMPKITRLKTSLKL